MVWDKATENLYAEVKSLTDYARWKEAYIMDKNLK